MNVFDIVGPVMIGPSSSHTAGACRIGKFARAIFNSEPIDVDVILSGSFARTYSGHGTDKAIVAGLMGFDTGDKRIKNSLEIAKQKGFNISISTFDFDGAHPNTCKIILKENNIPKYEMMACSVGGGNILITDINKTKVAITGLYDTIVVNHLDIPGMIYRISELLYRENININGLTLSRVEKRKEATVIIEVDDSVKESIIEKLFAIPNVIDVKILHTI